MKNEIPKGKYCRDYRPYVKIINGLWLELSLRAKNFTNKHVVLKLVNFKERQVKNIVMLLII
jgi:hypothetical protein